MKRLNYILNYELSTLFLIGLNIFLGLTLVLAIVASIIFTPYMLHTLYKEGKYGWIIFFFILIVPLSLFDLLYLHNPVFKLTIIFIQLGLFYFYCFLLKLTTSEWIQGKFACEQLDNSKKQKKYF